MDDDTVLFSCVKRVPALRKRKRRFLRLEILMPLFAAAMIVGGFICFMRLQLMKIESAVQVLRRTWAEDATRAMASSPVHNADLRRRGAFRGLKAGVAAE
jgi:hypothetical protein